MRHLFFFFSIFLAFLTDAQVPSSNSKKVASSSFGSRTVTVFKRACVETPYEIKVSDKKNVREFYVIKYASDVFNYLLVEKKGANTTYYPLVWSDLKAITVSEITQRSKDIVSGKVPSVPRTSL